MKNSGKGSELFRERVLYEDNHIIIVNKLSSEIVQADKTGDRTLADEVKEYIRVTCNKKGNVFLGTVHRLDRPTSGAVIFARTGKALSRLNEMLKKREIRKIYWAVVDSMPPADEGVLEHYLTRNTRQNKSYASVKEVKDSKKASLSYKVLGATDNYYLLQIELHTGRHHQIRAQLAEAGCVIKGDLKYGSKRSNPGGGIHLHARSVAFEHPVSHNRIEVTAPVPKDSLWYVFSEL